MQFSHAASSHPQQLTSTKAAEVSIASSTAPLVDWAVLAKVKVVDFKAQSFDSRLSSVTCKDAEFNKPSFYRESANELLE